MNYNGKKRNSGIVIMFPILGWMLFVVPFSAHAELDIDLPADVFGVETIIEQLETTLFGIGQEFINHIPYLVAGLIVLLLTGLFSNLLGRLGKRIAKRSSLRPSLQDLIQRLISISTWALGLLLAAMVVFPGLTPTKALGGLGIASVAIGFAFKDIFENFFAGILLLWRFPFESGDFIECEDLIGCVEEITIRMTKIRQTSGELIVVPNSFLFKNPVFVLTNKKKRRTSIIVGIAYDENVDDAIPVITDAATACESVDQGTPVEVFMKEFGASSVDIEVAWWADSMPLGLRRSRHEVVAAIKRALDEHKIEIPYPYRTLVFKDSVGVRQLPAE